MSADRDITRIVESWLEEGVTAIPDRVLDDVLAQVPATSQRRATWWPMWRFTEMTNVAKLAAVLATVAMLVLAGGAIMFGVGAAPAASPSPTGAAPSASPSATASSGAAGSVPGEFTACVPSNSELRRGTDERVVVSDPDGDMTRQRRRGFTWSGNITATDERFSGTHYYSWDGDEYTLPSGLPGPRVAAEGHRIENDEGAWQGSAMMASLSTETPMTAAVFLTGEGAYEGLTAVLFPSAGGCFFDFKGIVIEVPEPPVPATTK